MNRETFLKSLKSGEGTESYYEENKIRPNAVRERFLRQVRSGIYPKTMRGAFSPEIGGSDAYVEERIKPKEGGSFYKLYGCTYLYKGTFEDDIVHGIQMPKAMLSGILANMLKMRLIAIGWVFTYIFRRKKLLLFLNTLFDDIDHRVMRWYDIPEPEYNELTKEIKRAVKEACFNNLWGNFIWRTVKFICLVLETDNAYRLRVQDAVYEAHKRGNLTIYGILDVLIERETSKGIAHKWKLMKTLLRVMLPISPELKRIINATLKGLNVEKIRMDDADWYFCLKFLSYNFRGTGINFRLADRARIDRERGHIYLL